jgi:hypothetical protein
MQHQTGARQHCNSGYATYSALSAEGVLLPLPEAVPETDTETRRYLALSLSLCAMVILTTCYRCRYHQAEERRKLRVHPITVDEALQSFNEIRLSASNTYIDFMAIRSSLGSPRDTSIPTPQPQAQLQPQPQPQLQPSSYVADEKTAVLAGNIIL